MRPIRRGSSPQDRDFRPYTKAKDALVARIGRYCNYCERYMETSLAVEHIQAKILPHYAHLEGCWENFLLGCASCNSSKGKADLLLANFQIPDRDNTLLAFLYHSDGRIEPAQALGRSLRSVAEATVELLGLDQISKPPVDKKRRHAIEQRRKERKDRWLVASQVRVQMENDPANSELREAFVNLVKKTGYFSIWMAVFADDPDMRNRLIDAFPGTRESGCFDANGAPISPAPNPDNLPYGGKL